MPVKNVEELFRKVINDRDIFYYPADLLFSTREWNELKSKEADKRVEMLNDKIDALNKQITDPSRRKQKDELLRLARGFETALKQRPETVKQVLDVLNDFGVLECRLTKRFLENLGRVMETYSQNTAERFIQEKLDGARDKESKALKRLLEYVKELYSMPIDLSEKAYFIKKLHTFTQFVEVLK